MVFCSGIKQLSIYGEVVNQSEQKGTVRAREITKALQFELAICQVALNGIVYELP